MSEEEKEAIIVQSKIKKSDKNKDESLSKIAQKYLDLLGGKDNIQKLANCYTRLRITLNKTINIEQEQVKELGAIALKKIDDYNIQIIIGPQVEKLKNEITKIIKGS